MQVMPAMVTDMVLSPSSPTLTSRPETACIWGWQMSSWPGFSFAGKFVFKSSERIAIEMVRSSKGPAKSRTVGVLDLIEIHHPQADAMALQFAQSQAPKKSGTAAGMAAYLESIRWTASMRAALNRTESWHDVRDRWSPESTDSKE
jgi:hypothetical protein